MNTQIIPANEESIIEAARLLNEGRLVGLPTETVYGLGASIEIESAIQSVFKVKERPSYDPLIVHIPWESNQDLESLKQWVNLDGFSKKRKQQIYSLTSVFWPGPLTLVLPKNETISDSITSGLPTIALRSPSHPDFQKLLKKVPKGVAAPSANRFGKISPTRASHVLQELDGKIQMILDGGPCDIGIESTILLVTENELKILRKGEILPHQIEEQVNETLLIDTTSTSKPQAPGQLEQHYAPEKPFYLLPESLSNMSSSQKTKIKDLISDSVDQVGILTFEENPHLVESELSHLIERMITSYSLTENTSTQELYLGFRTLDDSEVDLILCEPCPSYFRNTESIMDRIQRATQKI
ncbi:MAG: threonylcarbamoyl-AMP synthase [Bdellovibrionaceae bacterium]|nr:threonylcarbamoyl-AMP synthase [Pseudobdellovibrionaceae bacterium]